MNKGKNHEIAQEYMPAISMAGGNRIKVAMVTGLGGIVQGGIETYLKNIYNKFIKLPPHIEMHVITIGDERREMNQTGVKVHYIKEAKIRTCKYHYYPLLIRKKILQINPDLIHIQSTVLPHNSIAVLSLVKRYPVVLTVHGVLAIEMHYRHSSLKSSITKRLQLYLERQLFKKVHHIIVPTPAVKELISDITESKIHVIPHGVDLEYIKNILPIQLKHPSLCFAGRLDKIKDVSTLLKSISIIRRSLPEIHLYVAGSGPEEIKLKNLVKELDIQKNITFLGFLPLAEVYSYFKSVDICVLPSHFETFGLVALEAMACGKPIIASNAGGIPFILENKKSGLLFECGDVDDLAQKTIQLLLNKELIEKMGKEGIARAREFTWDKSEEKTIELYENILNPLNG